MENKQELPAGWKWVKLGEVCEINPSRRKIFGRSPDAPTSFVPMESVDEVSGKISKVFIVPYSKVAKGYTYFEENDILFAKITPCMQNGKHAIAKNLIDGIGFGTTEFHVIRPSNAIIPEWVWFFIRQKAFLNEAMNYFTGSVGQQRVPKNFLSEHIIPLPPLSEQKRIAEKLKAMMDEIDEAKASIEKQLEAAKALPSAYLREVFESPEAQKWEKKKLGEVCEIYGGDPAPQDKVYFDNGSIPFVRMQDLGRYHMTDNLNKTVDMVNHFAVEHLNLTVFPKGCILIPRSGSVYTNHRAILGVDACVVSHIAILKPKESINELYLYYYLCNFDMNEISSFTTGLDLISFKDLKEVHVFFPPLPEQKRIASYLKEKIDQAEKLRETLEKELETLNALPQSILSKAFKGEI